MMIFFALLVISLVCFLIWCELHKRNFKSLNNIPGPRPYPVIGNVFDFGLNSVDFLGNLLNLTNTYKPTAKVWLGPNTFCLISTDPELMGFILKNPKYVKKGAIYEGFKCFFRDGLITAEENLWAKRRRILNPAFHMKLLEGFNSTFSKQSGILMELFAKNMNKGDLDINDYITNLSADVICATSMGAETNFQTGEARGFHDMVAISANIMMRRIFSAWRQFDFLFQFTADYRKLQELTKYGEDLIRGHIIERRIETLTKDDKKENELETDDADLSLKKKKVFLDILLTSTIDGKPLTNDEIQGEVQTSVTAGYETTSLMITFALYELSRHPEIQDKVLAEVREIFNNDPNYCPTLQDYSKMKYTENVLKESLRLYTPVPFIARQLTENADFNGTLIPKDTNIILFFYGMHRREDLFQNADKFDPERFIPGSGRASEHPYSFLPFSSGPRNCIGYKFASYEGKCVLSRVLMNFELLPAAKDYNMTLSTQVVLKPRPGVFCQMRKRQLD